MNTKHTFIAAACLALNLSLAKIAALLSLPVYLDTVGTIVGAALLPWPLAVAVALCTSFLGAVVINPYWAAYCGTQLAIGLTALGFVQLKMFTSWWKAIISGFLTGMVAMIVSAPVTVVLFGGVTLSGTTAINAIFLASGKSIWQSVIGGSFVIESIDKPLAALLALLTLKRLPKEFIYNRNN